MIFRYFTIVIFDPRWFRGVRMFFLVNNFNIARGTMSVSVVCVMSLNNKSWKLERK